MLASIAPLRMSGTALATVRNVNATAYCIMPQHGGVFDCWPAISVLASSARDLHSVNTCSNEQQQYSGPVCHQEGGWSGCLLLNQRLDKSTLWR